MTKVAGHDVYQYGWMDSAAVYFIDPQFGPGDKTVINRRAQNGSVFGFDVPRFNFMYNKKMGGVDCIDYIRKLFGCELAHRTLKWTVRFDEVGWTFVLTQAYNVHREVNKRRPTKLLSHKEFIWSVFKGLITDRAVMGTHQSPSSSDRHELKKFEVGSRQGDDARRKRGECRQCPNTYIGDDGKKHRSSRRTSWFCSVCKVAFHPECFVKWHSEKSLSYRPPKSFEE
jgi:ferredoxin-thioredoxin reductase catalytic subunit